MLNLKVWIKETGEVEKVFHLMHFNDDTLINRMYVVGKDCLLILNGYWVDDFLTVSGMEYDPKLNSKVKA